MRTIKIRLPGSLHKRLKVDAAKSSRSLVDIVRDAIDDYPEVEYEEEEMQYTTVSLSDSQIEKLWSLAGQLRSDLSGALAYMIRHRGER